MRLPYVSKSIMQSDKACYVTATTRNLEKHHIYGGARRKLYEKYGCWVYLTLDYHTGRHGVHRGNTALANRLKQECQRTFEQTRTREEFMRIFGRNYLD